MSNNNISEASQLSPQVETSSLFSEHLHYATSSEASRLDGLSSPQAQASGDGRTSAGGDVSGGCGNGDSGGEGDGDSDGCSECSGDGIDDGGGRSDGESQGVVDAAAGAITGSTTAVKAAAR